MVSTDGLLTVADAAKRLKRSNEQVRRYLREGKLKGRRIGNQWFITESALDHSRESENRLIPRELIARADRNREDIYHRTGIVFDVVEMLRLDRESH